MFIMIRVLKMELMEIIITVEILVERKKVCGAIRMIQTHHGSFVILLAGKVRINVIIKMKILKMKEIQDIEDARPKRFQGKHAYHGVQILQEKMEISVLSLEQMGTIVFVEILVEQRRPFGAMLVIHKIRQKSLVIHWGISNQIK